MWFQLAIITIFKYIFLTIFILLPFFYYLYNYISHLGNLLQIIFYYHLNLLQLVTLLIKGKNILYHIFIDRLSKYFYFNR